MKPGIKIHRDGIDPSAEKQAAKNSPSDSFESIAREWIGIGAPTGNRRSAPPKQATIDRMEQRLEAFIFPWVGKRPIKAVEIADLRRALDRISDRGTFDTAHRVRSVVDRVYRYAITTGRAERNIAADLKGALRLTPAKSHAAITDPKAFGELLRAIDGYFGQPTVMAALKLAPLLFQRPGELRHAEWAEIDVGDALWSIPASKMKSGLDHTVPLATQAIEIIEELRPISGHARYLFPSLRTDEKPISDNTINAALRRLGYDNKAHVAHGFRASASTLLHELGFDPDVIDQQLAHKRQGVSAVYNRSHLLQPRREMMQAWAEYLESLR
ncbi:MAG: site-specific integrase [Pseudomonadota bacterium]